MRTGPSQTALHVALLRAAHQLFDQPPVFEDPLALQIVGSEAVQSLRTEPRWTSPPAANFRGYIAVRSRYTEDRFASAFGRGVRQYVIMGAGLDTFAYRQRFDGLRVFEIDHPATQGWKRERLAEAGIAVPGSIVFVPIDFERETLRDALDQASFDWTAPAFFAWLGVTVYLAPASTMSTLGSIAKFAAAGSEIVFDFAVPAGQDERAKMWLDNWGGRVDAVGEPMRSAFEPERLANDVRSLGFTHVEVIDIDALNSRYQSNAYVPGAMMRATI